MDVVETGQPALDPGQCRAGRALLDWSQDDLAHRAGVSRGTVKKIEGGGRISPLHAKALRTALEDGRCLFLDGEVSLGDVAIISGVALRA